VSECGWRITRVSGPWGSREAYYSCSFEGYWGPNRRCYYHQKTEAAANGGLPIADLSVQSCERVLRAAAVPEGEEAARLAGLRWLVDIGSEEGL
jgi:hypothetical protein